MADEEKLMDTEVYVKGPRVTLPIEYNKRDLILYALGIGSADPRFVYELHPDFAAFPTYPVCFLYKGTSFDALPYPPPTMMQVPAPIMHGAKAFLDAEKYIEKVAELPKDGTRLFISGGVVGVHKKGSGAFIDKTFEVTDESGKVYYRIIDGTFQVGARGYRESGVSCSRTAPPPAGPPAHVVEMPTDARAASIYRLSGDYNPLHVDSHIARRQGFESPILHGLCSLGHATRAVLDTVAGGDQRRFRSVQMRFASPTRSGQTFVVEMWCVSPVEIIFRAKVKETGAVCISNGLMRLHPAASL
mmetsp:Transcript_9752/g.22411  ORF Transcript_9752/g.22411 Transcript_9752/m.22411 type:complete len:302 (+) Transcript_9752:3-908(+)